MDSFWIFARRMLRYRWTVAGAIVMAFVSAGGLGAGLLGLKPVLDNILGARKDLPTFARELNELPVVGGRIPESVIEALPGGAFTAIVWIMVALGVLTILGGLANFLHAYLSLTVVNRTIANIRREVFHRVLRLPLKEVVASGPSDIISRIVNDSNTLATGFNAVLSRALAQITKGLAGVVIAFIYDWRLAFAALLVAPLLMVTIRKLGKRIRRASRKALDSQAGLYGAAAEALQGLRVVKVHTTERYEAGRFHRINKEVMRQMNRARTARAVASPLVEVMTVLALGILVLIAARGVMTQQLDPTALIATLLALGITGASLKPLTGVLNDIQAAAAASDRLQELLRRAPEAGHDQRLPRLPRHSRSITFRNVSFTYPGAARPALREIDLEIAHGERVAIVGPNGSGKTTLLALVPRLFDADPAPDAGSVNGESPAILIDGRDIRTVSIRSLRKQIGMVTQETVLFRASIRANIAYGAENASEGAIVSAARKARAHEFIAALPQGYDTVVGEQGATLSGGQRQRIAIARAILREPSILILDEATSMIDADSEAKIAEAISEFSTGRTCLIVAHRLSTVMNADRIAVMDEGRIIDQGSHDELLERCTTYRLIAENQLVRPVATGSAPATAEGSPDVALAPASSGPLGE
jgi:ABC-type multidrug transport system fused ATPase/permease subunit